MRTLDPGKAAAFPNASNADANLGCVQSSQPRRVPAVDFVCWSEMVNCASTSHAASRVAGWSDASPAPDALRLLPGIKRSDNVVELAADQAVGSRSAIVLAGPGSSMTVPGLIAAEIALALARSTSVTRIEVDLGSQAIVGLHRAPSLAAAHGAVKGARIVRHQAPTNARLRTKAFQKWIGPEVKTAIAYAWPGIDNGWIKQYVEVAHAAGASTIVVCASLPNSNRTRIVKLADALSKADLVLVGNLADATELMAAFGPSGPSVEIHRALSLEGRSDRPSQHLITAFLAKDDVGTLSTLLAAFDAIPEAWIDGYQLRVVVRHAGPDMPEMVAGSHYPTHVQLIGEEISAVDLELLCLTSSALCVVDPAFDSRTYRAAVNSGVATVVLGGSLLPEVGDGYVGGLLADLHRPASVHVALTHALRLSELAFPHPDTWEELAQRLNGMPRHPRALPRFLEPTTRAG